MKVSIITVSFNSVNTIADTIESVLNQDFPNIEYIIVDGNSSDGTVDIIRQYENQISKWISEKDQGMYDAMNKGIAMATGDVIGILNSDDVYMNQHVISELMGLMHEKNAKVVFAEIVITNTEPVDKSIVVVDVLAVIAVTISWFDLVFTLDNTLLLSTIVVPFN